MVRLLLTLPGLLILLACDRGVRPHLDDHYPERLSEYRLFTGTLRDLKPSAGVLQYDVNTPLFSDGAAKHRTVWMPSGVSGTYKKDGVFDLPVGTILSKTFSFDDRRIETRLYIHKKNGWAGVTYVWNRAQTDAVLDVTPAPVMVESGARRFEYEIPNVNQCKLCHEGPNDNGPLGITAKQLNRGGQLAQWTQAGYLKDVEASPPSPRLDLDSRARDYLDVNCGTCHVVGGRGMKSGIFLTAAESARDRLGVCRPASNANGAFNIVPGQPERSMLLHRMTSLDRKIMMPDVAHSIVDDEGVQLIRAWISSMPGDCTIDGARGGT